TFQYDGADELTSFDRSNCAITYHNGTSWITIPPYGPVSGGNPYTRSVLGITDFGNYSIQSIVQPLPVSLLEFNAVLKGNDGSVYWRTTNEVNVDHYILERSVDGNNFNEIVNLPSQTQSSVYKLYNHLDKNLNLL